LVIALVIALIIVIVTGFEQFRSHHEAHEEYEGNHY